MIGLPKFFRTYQNKRFNYIPRFYDKQKEEMKERIQRIEKEMGIEREGTIKIGITRGSMRRAQGMRSSAGRVSSIRLLVIILILAALAYFLLYK